MAKPFQITLLPDAKPVTTKPGWHRRALTAAKRASYTTRTVAPQRGDPRADAKAVDYALWLAARDGTAIPAGTVTRVDWQPCEHGYRPRAVLWVPESQAYRPAARGMAQPAIEPLLRIDLPHWDYEAPAVVEVTLLVWSAPVVTELPAAAHGPAVPVLDPCEPVAVADPCEPVPFTVAASEAVEAGNDDAAPVPPPAGPDAALAPVEPAESGHVEPLAICPAVGLPCKADCGFRSGCGRPVEAEACPVAAAEAEPLAALCSDDDAPSPRAPRKPRAPRTVRTPVVVIPTRTPVVGIAGGVLPASIMRQVIPGLARCPAPLFSPASA